MAMQVKQATRVTGALRSMMGSGSTPAWPDIPWHVTDSAAAVPGELSRAAAEDRDRCVTSPVVACFPVLALPLTWDGNSACARQNVSARPLLSSLHTVQRTL